MNTQRPWFLRRWLDICWIALMGAFLVYAVQLVRSGWVCAYMGTDFRGYYASAQIAREHGFAQVYDPQLQSEFQASLTTQCREPSLPQPMPTVYTPYLPVFILFFLPLTLLNFTTSYLIWVILNLATFSLYLRYFAKAIGQQLSSLRLLQWVISIPMVANLFLGQMNVWLVICLGEFFLFYIKGQAKRSGIWLGGMLLKPHILILLLPGLFVSQSWGTLLGFGTTSLLILGASFLLAGTQGLAANLLLITQFAGPLIQTAPSMMNYRALALNLAEFLPPWFAWAVAICAMILVVVSVLWYWRRCANSGEAGYASLLVLTWAGTLAVAWHSHFYLMLGLIPLLIFLDNNGLLPLWVWGTWLLTPFLIYALANVINPESVRNIFGLGMLALSQVLLIWSGEKLSKSARTINPR